MTFDLSPAAVAIISLGINSVVGVLMAWIAFKNASLRTAIEKQGTVLREVEKQGNSVSLELKRTNMVYARRLAEATKGTPAGDGDKAIADDAQKVYEEAQQQVLHRAYPVT